MMPAYHIIALKSERAEKEIVGAQYRTVGREYNHGNGVFYRAQLGAFVGS
ncbi:hypothetical protein SL267_13850 [Serratia marcescens]|nr:hypothetical protein SL267_13850 [Serratia marcescens]